MTDNVVGLDGAPVPDTDYNAGLVDILEQAIGQIKRGNVAGIALVMVTTNDETIYGIDCSFEGPQLMLLAGCQRLAYKLNMHLDVMNDTDSDDG
jgi:hypothetical protein